MSSVRGCVPLVCLVVAACGGGNMASQKPLSPSGPAASSAPADKPAPSTQPTAASDDKTTEAAGGAASDLPVVTLVAPGAEPRKELRYHVTEKQKEHMKMVTLMDMHMALGGRAMPHTVLPPMAADMTLAVKKVGADGNFDYDFSIDRFATEPDPSTSREVAASLDANLSHMAGTTGSASMTPRGFTLHAEVNVPPDVDPMTRRLLNSIEQSMRQLANPLPAEPVGIGAKWDVTMHPTVRGIAVTQTYHVKLVSRQGDRFKLDMGVEQAAAPQTLHLPNLPPGARVQLVSLTSTGTAQAELDLSRLVPIHSKAKIESKSHMKVTSGGQTQPMSTDVKMAVEIAPGKP